MRPARAWQHQADRRAQHARLKHVFDIHFIRCLRATDTVFRLFAAAAALPGRPPGPAGADRRGEPRVRGLAPPSRQGGAAAGREGSAGGEHSRAWRRPAAEHGARPRSTSARWCAPPSRISISSSASIATTNTCPIDAACGLKRRAQERAGARSSTCSTVARSPTSCRAPRELIRLWKTAGRTG